MLRTDFLKWKIFLVLLAIAFNISTIDVSAQCTSQTINTTLRLDNPNAAYGSEVRLQMYTDQGVLVNPSFFGYHVYKNGAVVKQCQYGLYGGSSGDCSGSAPYPGSFILNEAASGTYRIEAVSICTTFGINGSINVMGTTTINSTEFVIPPCSPATPVVILSSNPVNNSISSGTNVTFTAVATNTNNGTVNYDFKVNGISKQSGAGNVYSTSALANGDNVTCSISVTGGFCLTANSATSNTIPMIVAAPGFSALSTVQINGKPRVVGKQLVNQCGNPLQLRGMSTHGLQWFSQCNTPDALKALKNDWNADIVRLAMYVNENGYLTDTAYFRRQIDAMVDSIGKLGMYCIIDWHMLTPGDPNANLTDAKLFWDYMSKKHAGKKHVFYEICNEPNGVPWSSIKSYANTIIPIIRANDPATVIICGTPDWSSNVMAAASDPITGPNATNLVYTFHFYAASHDSYMPNVRYAAGIIPLFTSEWGLSTYTGGGAISITSGQQWMDIFNGANNGNQKISWCNWTFSDANESSAGLNPGACATKSWNNTSPSGTQVKTWINSPAKNFISCCAMPALTLTVGPNDTVAAGANVTFTASAIGTSGGTVLYNFLVNGVSKQTSTSPAFSTSSLANGDFVTCTISIAGGVCLLNNSATSNTIYLSVVKVPLISSFTPASGMVGSIVTIKGQNFTGITSLKFNTTSATGFTILNDSTISANVPAGATSGKISFKYSLGTVNSIADFKVICNNQLPVKSLYNGPLCNNFGSLRLDVDIITGATYAWTGPNSFSANVKNPTRDDFATPGRLDGKYFIEVSVNGCVAGKDSLDVIHISGNPVYTLSSNGPLCTGDSMIVSLSNPYPHTRLLTNWSGSTFFPSLPPDALQVKAYNVSQNQTTQVFIQPSLGYNSCNFNSNLTINTPVGQRKNLSYVEKFDSASQIFINKYAALPNLLVSNNKNELKISCSAIGGPAKYDGFWMQRSATLNFPINSLFQPLNLAGNTIVKFKAKASSPANLRLDLRALSIVTNFYPQIVSLPGDNQYHEYTLDYSGKFQKDHSFVDSTNVSSLDILINPDSPTAFTGEIFVDDIQIGSEAKLKNGKSILRVTPVTGANYIWYKDGAAIANSNQPSLNITSTGRYALQTIGANLCNSVSDPVVVKYRTNVNSFSPAAGIVGAQVTLKGTNLLNTVSVKFTGSDPADFTILNDSTIAAIVPAGTTTGKIRVIASGDTAFSASDYIVWPPVANPGISDNFNDNKLSCRWMSNASYVLNEVNGELKVDANVQAMDWPTFWIELPKAVNLRDNASLTLKVKSDLPVKFRADVMDSNYVDANANPIEYTLDSSSVFSTLTFNFSNHFNQAVPSAASVDSNNIKYIYFFVNPGATSGFNGTIYLDDLVLGSGGLTDGGVSVCLPSITSFSPGSAPVNQIVVIKGKNLTGTTEVKFNGILSTSFIVVSDTSITATVPVGASTGPISISTAIGVVSSSNNFIVSQPQTITFPAQSAVWLGSSFLVLNATSSSGLPVSYSVSNATIASVSNDTLYLKKAGTVTVTASQAGNSNFLAATDVNRSLVVSSKQYQAINFQTLPAKLVTDEPFGLTAISSSGLPVTFKSSNTAVAIISGDSVIIKGAGTVTITALQTGNAFYNAAPSVNQTLKISKLTQAITFSALPSKTVTDSAFVLTATSSSGLPVTYKSSNTTLAVVSGDTVIIKGAGTVSITASQTGNATYLAAISVNQSLKITKLTQSITFNALPAMNVADAPLVLTASSSSGLPVTYKSSNTAVAVISGDSIIIKGAGTSTITASQTGDATYLAATSVNQSLKITKLAQFITFNPLPAMTVVDVPFVLTSSVCSGLPVTYRSSNTAVADVSGDTVVIKGAGTVTITALQTGNATYNAATSINQSLKINKLSQVITFNTIPAMTVVDAPFVLFASASSGLPVTYKSSNTAVAEISGDTVIIKGAGTVSITASQAGNPTYIAAPVVSKSFTVSKLAQTVTFNALPTRTVNDLPFIVSAAASSGLPLTYTSSNLSVAIISGDSVIIVGGGSTSIKAIQAGNAIYNTAFTSRTLTVSKLSQTISFPVIPVHYTGDASFSPGANSSSGIPVTYSSTDTNVAKINGSEVVIIGAGTCYIKALQGGNQFYNAASLQRQLKVLVGTSVLRTDSDLEAQTMDAIPMYPNPLTKGQNLSVDLSNGELATIKIFNLNGEVMQVKNDIIDSHISLNLDLNSGVYWVEVETSSGRKRRMKLVVI